MRVCVCVCALLLVPNLGYTQSPFQPPPLPHERRAFPSLQSPSPAVHWRLGATGAQAAIQQARSDIGLNLRLAAASVQHGKETHDVLAICCNMAYLHRVGKGPWNKRRAESCKLTQSCLASGPRRAPCLWICCFLGILCSGFEAWCV